MNPFIFIDSFRKGLRRCLWSVCLAAGLILLTGCLGGGETQPEAEAPLWGEVVLRCDDSCAARGQCGAAADGRQFVLGGGGGPMVENHDLLFPADTPVNILDSSVWVVATQSTGQESEHIFYRVALTDDNKQGWVAGWCVAAP